MMAAIWLGMTLATAKRKGLVRGTVERETWNRLAAQIAEGREAGGEIEVTVDILG